MNMEEENKALREALHEAVRIADRSAVEANPRAYQVNRDPPITLVDPMASQGALAIHREARLIAYRIGDLAKKFGIDLSDCPSVKP